MSEDQKKRTKTGINYGSGGCGILPHSGCKYLCLNLDMQIDNFAETVSKDLPNAIPNATELESHLSNSIFLVSIGTNDFGLNYLDPGNNPKSVRSSNSSKKMNEREFINFLLEQFSLRLKRLVGLGAKKILVNNLGPLGCLPQYTRNTGNCVLPLNRFVKLYADGLPLMLNQIQGGDHNAPTFSYSDNFKFFQQVEAKGVIDTKHPCVVQNVTVCNNRDQVFFFDGVHTTEVVNAEFVDGCFDKALCTPNIKQLIEGREWASAPLP